MIRIAVRIISITVGLSAGSAWAICPYDSNCLDNPYGAGSPYNPDSPINPYGRYGSPYSNESANNPYATNAPKIYDQNGVYHGRLSSNPYDSDSIGNPYGQYGISFLLPVRTTSLGRVTLTGSL